MTSRQHAPRYCGDNLYELPDDAMCPNCAMPFGGHHEGPWYTCDAVYLHYDEDGYSACSGKAGHDEHADEPNVRWRCESGHQRRDRDAECLECAEDREDAAEREAELATARAEGWRLAIEAVLSVTWRFDDEVGWRMIPIRDAIRALVPPDTQAGGGGE